MKLKSIKCPKCSTLITDPNEIDFVLYNNCCFTCDHHTVWDDMTQEDIDAHREEIVNMLEELISLTYLEENE